MTVFISHAFDNQPEFENVTDWFDRLGVPYWKPTEIKSGASLRAQLRQAISACSVCVFVATHHSVASSWCGAELGAFWGAEVPVIVYLAEASLSEETLPPILRGDVWDRKLSRIAERAAELVKERAGAGAEGAPSPGDKITSVTVKQLGDIIAGAISLVRAGEERGISGKSAGNLGATALDAAGRVLRAADAASQISQEPRDNWLRRILWVDDRPDNNTYERQVFETLGFTFDLSLSTDDALERLNHGKYGAIISDMGRREGPREGYKLLDAVRVSDEDTPFFIYAATNAPEHKREAINRGAQGNTNMANELVELVTEALRLRDAPHTDGHL